LHQYRIEKLWSLTPITAASAYHREGYRKGGANPNACKDEQGRLRVAAATSAAKPGSRSESIDRAGVTLSSSDTRMAIRGAYSIP